MVLVGTSLGGAIAMDFALEYPEAVEKLVLVDAQGFIDGLGPWRVAPRWLINLLVQVSTNPGSVSSLVRLRVCTAGRTVQGQSGDRSCIVVWHVLSRHHNEQRSLEFCCTV